MCYDYMHLDTLSDISAYQTVALLKSLQVYDSVVNSILNRTVKIKL